VSAYVNQKFVSQTGGIFRPYMCIYIIHICVHIYICIHIYIYIYIYVHIYSIWGCCSQ